MTRLLFVYGNDGGMVNSVIHCMQKVVSPRTYGCSLCAITNHPLGQRKAWKRALAELGIEGEFLHRDEMVERFGPDHPPLPAVFVADAARPSLLIAKPEIDACHELDALVELLRQRLALRRLDRG